MGSRARRRQREGRQPITGRSGATGLLPLPTIQTPGVLGAVQRRPLVRLPDGGIGYCMTNGDECFRAALATAIQVPIEQIPDFGTMRRFVDGGGVGDVSRAFWARYDAWLTARGLTAALHDDPPLDSQRWIGIVPSPNASVAPQWVDDCELCADGPPQLADDEWAYSDMGWRYLCRRCFAARVGRALTPAECADLERIAVGERATAGHSLVMTQDRILFDPAIGLPVPAGLRLYRWRPEDVTYGLTITPTGGTP